MSSSCLTFLTTQRSRADQTATITTYYYYKQLFALCQRRNALIVKQNLLDAVSVEQNQINVDYRGNFQSTSPLFNESELAAGS